MKRIYKLATAGLVAVGLVVARPAQSSAADDASVHHIDLPHYMPYLPPGPNRDLYASRCLSCHTMRYITTQPKLSQAKWEAEATKMIKTYGAPIQENEAGAIAQYLVFLQNAPPEKLARTVSATGALPALSGAGNADHGKQVFSKSCASCHGTSGKGDGIGMHDLLPKAADLTGMRFDREAVQRSILKGVPGTAMPAASTLSADDVNDVIAYVGSLSAGDAEPANASTADAKTMYESVCASCHGKDGAADGFNAPTLPRSPTNFKMVQPSQQHAIDAITNGVAGTAMPSWKAKFNDAQRASLAGYVRTLYAAGK